MTRDPFSVQPAPRRFASLRSFLARHTAESRLASQQICVVK
jgi:hypothetical protein